jgi:hypothetical protein
MKPNKRKLLSLICCLLLILCLLPIQTPKVKAINNVWIEVMSRRVGMKATYKFHFTIEKTLRVHQYIKLIFPKGTTMPPEDPNPPPPKDPGEVPPPRDPTQPPGGSDPGQGLPIIDYAENSLKFNSHIELDPSKEGYKDITVTIPDVVGICNPAEPGFYKCKVSTQAEPTPVESAPYEIVESKIGVPQGMPEVRVTPSIPGSNASYQIYFNVGIGGWLKAEDGRIRIRFPQDTIFSKTDIPSASIQINGTPLKERPILSKTNMTMICPVEIKDSGRVVVSISDQVGIINPSLPGDYKLEVSTMPTDPDWATSGNYRIQQGGPVLQVDPPEVTKTAEYSFSFLPTPGQEITSKNPMMVKFPEGTGMPSVLDPTNILVNGKEVKGVTITGLDVSISPALPINSTEMVQLLFKKELGIQNPTLLGEIRLAYKLKDESEYSYTQPVILEKIREKLETTVQFIGGTLGKNGWFVLEPMVQLQCSNPDATIFYYWNNQSNQKKRYDGKLLSPYPAPDLPPGIPIPPDPGQIVSKLTFWSEMAGAIDSAKEVIIKIDQVNPELTMETPADTRIVTKDITCLIKGRTTMIKTVRYDGDSLVYDRIVTINNLPVSVSDKDGSFSQEIPLSQGENKVMIRAEDEAGRYVEKEFVIISDSVPPSIEVYSPIPESVVMNQSVAITGKIDDPSALLLINGEIADTDSDGSFSFTLQIKGHGKIHLTLEATDRIGNTNTKIVDFWFGYTMVLQIGSKTATNNGIQKLLTVAPFIQNGKTLVPFRFIGEQLGAEIDFTLDPPTNRVKTVSYMLGTITIRLTIGDNIAFVNGHKVLLDVPAYITTGTTVVPLRFVAESLGCNLNWNSESQTITILYPK